MRACVTNRSAVAATEHPDRDASRTATAITDIRSVTYSLPGSVFLTFPSMLDVERGHVRLLHDVSVVLEGKAEYWDDYGESGVEVGSFMHGPPVISRFMANTHVRSLQPLPSVHNDPSPHSCRQPDGHPSSKCRLGFQPPGHGAPRL